jgi:hypothetical protein
MQSHISYGEHISSNRMKLDLTFKESTNYFAPTWAKIRFSQVSLQTAVQNLVEMHKVV